MMAPTLLKPARDLVENWSIDVAAELDAYLHQLETAEKAADKDDAGSSTTELNFVEAALILQSSTSVYAKKVEYLRALAYETLNTFGSSSHAKRLDDKLLSGQPLKGRHSKVAEDWDISEAFINPYNATTHGKEIDLVPDTDENFKYISLTVPGVHSTAQSVWDNKRRTLYRTPLVLLPKDDRNEYRVVSSEIHSATGSLFANPQDAIEFESALNISQLQPATPMLSEDANQSIGLGEDTIGSISTHLNGFQNPSIRQAPIEPISTVSALPRTALAELSYNTSPQPPSMLNQSVEGGSQLFPRHESTRFACTGSPDDDPHIKKTAEDLSEAPNKINSKHLRARRKKGICPLVLLDCHKPTGRDRPLKIGSTFKPLDHEIYLCSAETLCDDQLRIMLRKGVVEASTMLQGAAINDTDNNLKESENLNGKKENKKFKVGRIPYFVDLRCPVYPLSERFHLGYEWRGVESDFTTLRRSRKVFELLSKREKNLGSSFSSPSPSDRDESSPHNSNWNPDENYGDENCEVDCFDADASSGPKSKELSKENAQESGRRERPEDDFYDIAGRSELDSLDIENALRKAQSSYAEVIQQRLATLEGSNATLSTSIPSDTTDEAVEIFTSGMSLMELHRKITKWRSCVEKWIETTKKRGPFDVIEYKQRIAKKIISSSSDITHSETALAVKEDVPFQDLVRGESRAEVCRFFLTALLMSNEQTVVLNENEDEARNGSHENDHNNREEEEEEGGKLCSLNDIGCLCKRNLTLRLVTTLENIQKGETRVEEHSSMECDIGDEEPRIGTKPSRAQKRAKKRN